MNKTEEQPELMILTAVVVHVIKAKLGMPRTMEAFYRKSFNMQAAIAANEMGYFTPAFNRLDVWKEENREMKTALNAIKKDLPGATGLKNEAMEKLHITLNLALIFVNNLVLLNQSQAFSIIQAALMTPVKTGKRIKPEISVKQLAASGSIKITVIAARINGKLVDASYEWEYSTDGSKTWIRLSATLGSYTIATGMQTGKITLFRERTTTKEGTGKWVVSKPITPA